MKLNTKRKTFFIIFLLEITFIIILFSFFPQFVFAGVGSPNVIVKTNLTVGNVFPELSNVTIENNASTLDLTPSLTRRIYCSGIATDYNSWEDVVNATATFFDAANSSYSDSNDNNLHYTNYSCSITQDNGDPYRALINCSFDIWYYANPGPWNCTMRVEDKHHKAGFGSDLIDISSLLALGLPDFIYYGEVNATEVSLENISNVTNYGNVKINLSLNGYGFYNNDGNAMNCTLGSIKNISIEHEKYNLTTSHPGVLDLTQTLTRYANLTSAPVVRRYNLEYRQNDLVNEAINSTYWRIYVPLGVAGTCEGNIVFGATTAPGI
ncbi:MAG TPA: hypothetical protein PLE51_02195 [Candidatus Pacearchaeota archaeon]|nr:hypothetical protein [Candidatus Pacearchaeota archaeon]HOR52454.1 hypothetical protein [Candidatus Pacearchaeota archaeon]HOU79240.1 hypothetical protein [Candidatus Pacearchaeota archaeon]HQF82571.1 hypothetical protein [Candidatus Pacearchaeota archaeon]HQI57795.1 hypothetical protein [Candidatus Pacearchaeota archaeon]